MIILVMNITGNTMKIKSEKMSYRNSKNFKRKVG